MALRIPCKFLRGFSNALLSLYRVTMSERETIKWKQDFFYGLYLNDIEMGFYIPNL